MVDVDVQGTSKITMICRAGPRGYGQRDTKLEVQNYSKPGNLNS